MAAAVIGDAFELGEMEAVFACSIDCLGVVIVQRSVDVAFPANRACPVATHRADEVHFVFQAYWTETSG